jgi:hypothetical protein
MTIDSTVPLRTGSAATASRATGGGVSFAAERYFDDKHPAKNIDAAPSKQQPTRTEHKTG